MAVNAGRGLVDDHDPLRRIAERKHDAPAFQTLFHEGWGDFGGRRRDQDAVEGCVLGPAVAAVADAKVHIPVAEVVQCPPRGRSQVLADLERVDFAREFGQHGRLVAGPRADFEHAFDAGQLQRLGHEGDDVGLRDGLAVADRQRSIAVGRFRGFAWNEAFASQATHRRQHARIGDAAFDQLGLDHVRAALVHGL